MAGHEVGLGQPARHNTPVIRYMPTLSPPVYPVQAKFDGHDFVSTGIDYADSMHVIKGHKPGAYRRLEPPAWAANNTQLLQIVVLYMEKLCLWRGPRSGTPQHRLEKAIAARLARRPQLTATLDKLAKEYVAEKENPVRRKALSIEIKCLDAVLRHLGHEHLNAIGVVRRYWLLGEDCVAVGNELGMSPMHVRVLLGRLKDVAQKELWKPRVSMRINFLHGLKNNAVQVAAKGQHTCWMCGKIFTPEAPNKHLCSKKCQKARKRAQDKKRTTPHVACGQRRWFCSAECKAAGIHIKKVMLAFKPGIGKFSPPPGGTSYDSYAQYCRVVGAVPMSLVAWNSGGVLKYEPRIVIKHKKK